MELTTATMKKELDIELARYEVMGIVNERPEEIKGVTLTCEVPLVKSDLKIDYPIQQFYVYESQLYSNQNSEPTCLVLYGLNSTTPAYDEPYLEKLPFESNMRYASISGLKDTLLAANTGGAKDIPVIGVVTNYYYNERSVLAVDTHIVSVKEGAVVARQGELRTLNFGATLLVEDGDKDILTPYIHGVLGKLLNLNVHLKRKNASLLEATDTLRFHIANSNYAVVTSKQANTLEDVPLAQRELLVQLRSFKKYFYRPFLCDITCASLLMMQARLIGFQYDIVINNEQHQLDKNEFVVEVLFRKWYNNNPSRDTQMRKTMSKEGSGVNDVLKSMEVVQCGKTEETPSVSEPSWSKQEQGVFDKEFTEFVERTTEESLIASKRKRIDELLDNYSNLGAKELEELQFLSSQIG